MAASISKLVAKDPENSMVIRLLTPNILTCSTTFRRFGRVHIGGRGTIVKLSNNTLAVFSPVALTQRVKTSMQQQLGTTDVRYLTALDQEHHIFLEQWHKEYPTAKVLAPESLPAYRDKQGYFKIPEENLILFKKGEKPKIDDAFDAEFESEFVYAHQNKELVFNHKPSKTLIEADYLFNLPAHEQHGKDATTGIMTKIFCYLNSTTGDGLAQRRFIWHALSSGDRNGFSESTAKIDAWDFDRIIPCHGGVIDTDGKGIFRKIFKWHLELAKKNAGGS